MEFPTEGCQDKKPATKVSARPKGLIKAQLFQKRKLSANSVAQHLAALRFLYSKALRRPWSLAETPYPQEDASPADDSQPGEVAQLLFAACTPYQRILLMTLYATGARRAALTHLKVSDIAFVVHLHSSAAELRGVRRYP